MSFFISYTHFKLIVLFVNGTLAICKQLHYSVLISCKVKVRTILYDFAFDSGSERHKKFGSRREPGGISSNEISWVQISHLFCVFTDSLCFLTLQALLHNAIFPATCLATQWGSSCKKNSRKFTLGNGLVWCATKRKVALNRCRKKKEPCSNFSNSFCNVQYLAHLSCTSTLSTVWFKVCLWDSTSWAEVIITVIVMTTLMMTSAHVVETSVDVTNNNSPSRDYSHPDDQTTQTTETPGFKPFTVSTKKSGISKTRSRTVS